MKTGCEATSKQPYLTTRRITTIALLGAISAVLGLTPLGFLQVGIISVTFMHIPVIIAAILEGPIAGGIVGLIFGISSIISNMPKVTGPIFLNPMVSVVPRVLIGIISAYVYKWTKNTAITAAAGTATNTIGVLSAIYFMAAQQFANIKGVTPDVVGKILLGTAATNGIAEIVVAIILVPAIIKGVNMMKK